ncbi:hypothetical protein [Faecalibaculum rodentium]|uniref:hypothetical protein n=1 Tax=Faecalibaculum rodentium TaxID=1702221 RepID=UPI002731AE40|nr:hypothetical protein [Faecalibaculum rodentium]
MKAIVEFSDGRTTTVDASDEYITITENGITISREYGLGLMWTRDLKPKKVTVIWE